MTKLSLRDLDVRGKRVLVRVDFNVPTELRGGKVRITDDTRIRESLPTINYLREHGAKTILMSHFGRPKGKPVEKYSLRPIGDYLHSLIHQPVVFSHDTIGEVPEKIVEHMHDGDVALLENLRFQPGEEANDPNFAKALASLGDLYVNDAFGAAHRAHASTGGITKFVDKSAMSLGELHTQLAELDPETAEKIDLKNRRRLVRALEICLLTGNPASTIVTVDTDRSRPESTILATGIFVFRDREELYARINQRVEAMFEKGVIEEVRAAGELSSTASQMIGFREIHELLDSKISLSQCVAAIQQATRRYAKRQLTWFRRQTNFSPLNLSLLSHNEAVNWVLLRIRSERRKVSGVRAKG